MQCLREGTHLVCSQRPQSQETVVAGVQTAGESGRRHVSVGGAGVKSWRACGLTVIYSERNGSHWKSWFCVCVLELLSVGFFGLFVWCIIYIE